MKGAFSEGYVAGNMAPVLVLILIVAGKPVTQIGKLVGERQ